MIRTLRTPLRLVAVSQVVATFLMGVTPVTTYGQNNILTNGNFEASQFDSGWVQDQPGAIVLHPGIAPGSTQAAKLNPGLEAGQNSANVGVFAGPDWEMELYFAGTAGGGRWFNVINQADNNFLGGASLINQRLEDSGNLQVFGGFNTGLFWQNVNTEVTFPVSEDLDNNGVLDAGAGDTVNIYRYKIQGFGFGTATPSYDIFVSDPNSETLVLRGSGLTFFQDTLEAAQDPERAGVSGVRLSKAFGSGSGFVVYDDIFIRSIGGSLEGNQWAGPGSGDWNNAGSWTSSIPNAAGAEARFGANINADSTVTLNSPITVGSLEFAGANLYTLAGPNTLTLNGTGVVNVPTLASGTEISAVVGGSSGLTKDGAGLLVLSGANTFSGGVTANRGSISVSADANLGNASNSITLNGGGLQVTGTTFASTARSVTLGDRGGQFDVVEESHTFAVNQPLSGNGGVVKSGLGTLQLGGANTYSGTTQVLDGAIAVANPTALGDAAGATILAGGESTGRLLLNNTGSVAENLNLGGRDTDQQQHIVNQAGNNTLTGALTVTNGGFIRLDSDAGNLNFGGDLGNAGSNAVVVLGGAGNGQFSGTFTQGENAVTGLTKTGTGTWAITNGSGNSAEQPNGNVLIAQGTLEIQDTQNPNEGELNASNITVLAGGTFDVDAFDVYSLQPTQTLGGDGTVKSTSLVMFGDNTVTPGTSTGTLTIDGALSASASFPDPNIVGGFEFELSGTTTIGGGVNDLIEVSGNLTLDSSSGGVNLTVLPSGTAGLANGTYRLFNAGSITGGSADLNLINTTRYGMTLSSTATQVNVAVTGSNASVTWTGATDSAWDIGTTQNWDNGGPDVFYNADHVTFNDSATNKAVEVAGSVIPSSVTFDNSAGNDYTVSGAGSIDGGTGIVKNGTGRATISTNNSFDGPVTINAGTLHAASNTALGSAVGGTTIASGATLDVGGADLDEEVVTVSGAGVGGQGAITSSAAPPGGFRNLRNVTLTGDTTFGAEEGGRWDIRTVDEDTPATLTGGGHALTVAGAGTVSLADIGETDLGDITINGGTLAMQFSTTLGRAGTATVNAGGQLSLFSNDAERPVPTPSKTIVLNGGALSNAIGGTGTGENLDINTPLVHSANSILNAEGGGEFSISTPLTGAGFGITKTGGGTVVLRGAHTYSGNTVIEAGTLSLGATTAAGGDFNNDGLSDGADFLVWQRLLAPPQAGGAAALNEWEANLGSSTGGSIANSPLIEVRKAGNLSTNGYTFPAGQSIKGSGTVTGNVVAGNGTVIEPNIDVAPASPTAPINASAAFASAQFGQREAVHAIDGSNLNFIGVAGEEGDPSKYTHTGGNDSFGQGGVNWLGRNAAAGNGDDMWFAVDLGAVLPISEINVFNFGVSTGTNNTRGVQQGDIYYRNDGLGNNTALNATAFDPTGWTLLGTAGAQTFTIGPTDGLAQGPDTINVGGVNARFFAIDVNANHGGAAGMAGLGEVQFFGPAATADTLTIDGDFTQNAGSTLAIDIGGALAGFNHDVLNITGAATINGGTLAVDLMGGFVPSLGDAFDILEFASASGAGYDTLNLPSLSAGLDWDTSNLLTTGVLSVVAAGGGLAAVPEPATCLLLVIGALATRTRQRR
jgi:autotransporter-associated beta strand protein